MHFQRCTRVSVYGRDEQAKYKSKTGSGGDWPITQVLQRLCIARLRFR